MLPLYRVYLSADLSEVSLLSLCENMQGFGTPDLELVQHGDQALEVLGNNPDCFDAVAGRIGWIFLRSVNDVLHPEGLSLEALEPGANQVLDFEVEGNSDVLRTPHMWNLFVLASTFVDGWFWLGTLSPNDVTVQEGRLIPVAGPSCLVDRTKLLSYALGI